MRRLAILLLGCVPCFAQVKLACAGIYTCASSTGIYVWRFDAASGNAHPSFLAAHPNNRSLYSANEHENATEPGNTVTAYAMDVAFHCDPGDSGAPAGGSPPSARS